MNFLLSSDKDRITPNGCFSSTEIDPRRSISSESIVIYFAKLLSLDVNMHGYVGGFAFHCLVKGFSMWLRSLPKFSRNTSASTMLTRQLTRSWDSRYISYTQHRRSNSLRPHRKYGRYGSGQFMSEEKASSKYVSRRHGNGKWLSKSNTSGAVFSCLGLHIRITW